MSSLHIEMWPVSRLIPYAGNPRQNDHAVDRMVAVIREFGFRVPLVVRSNGELVDGHLRLKAAIVLGMTDVPVILADDMTPEQDARLKNVERQLGPWPQLGKNDRGQDLTLVDAVAALRNEVHALRTERA